MNYLENLSIGQLHKKLPDLQKSPEVSDAVEKHKRLSHEKVSNTPEARLRVYMERLEKVFLNEDEATRERNIDLMRPKIHEAFVIRREDVPESYFELQQRIARERGQPVETIPEGTREQMKNVIIEDQTKSLDDWVDYLASDDAMYPTWFKYFVFRNITKLSQFDKEHGRFKERTKSTTAPFPDIYREPLAQVCDVYERVAKGDLATLNNPEFQTFISQKFPAQYAMFIQKTFEQSQESREQIEGQWVKYEKGDMEGAQKLYDSLQGKGTGWCTAGESTARHQIESGDFYVYYTNDKSGNPIHPRLAVRMDGKKIGEVRGILPHQEVEPLLQDVLDEKLATFGSEADTYRKKSWHMKRLTNLDESMRVNGAISDADAGFLYEIHEPIEGFGYEKDPRIHELQSQAKNMVSDEFISEVFSIKPTAIARSLREVTENTRIYTGDLELFLAYKDKNQNQLDAYLDEIRYIGDLLRKDTDTLTVEDLKILSGLSHVLRHDYSQSSDTNEFIDVPKLIQDKLGSSEVINFISSEERLSSVLGLKLEKISGTLESVSEETEVFVPHLRDYFLAHSEFALGITKDTENYYSQRLKNQSVINALMARKEISVSAKELGFVFFSLKRAKKYLFPGVKVSSDDLIEAIGSDRLVEIFGSDLGLLLYKPESLSVSPETRVSVETVEVLSDGNFGVVLSLFIYSLEDLHLLEERMKTMNLCFAESVDSRYRIFDKDPDRSALDPGSIVVNKDRGFIIENKPGRLSRARRGSKELLDIFEQGIRGAHLKKNDSFSALTKLYIAVKNSV